MNIDFTFLAIAMFFLLLTIMLYDFRKLFTRNLHKLNPKYMNDTNTVKGTKLELDKDGNTVIKPTQRYSFNRYL